MDERLVAALLRPAAYPAPPGRVELRETHISWVFLAGDRAYKVKKPVVLPFLDASTVDRRHRWCREEVRLNCRLAPRIYLGVRAIVPDGAGGLRIAPEDEPGAVDWAVEMVRYDESATLEARLGGGERVEAVADVGRLLAAFHALAPRAGGARAAAPRAAEQLGASLATIRASLGAPAPAWLAPLERLAGAAACGLWPLMAERERQGLVREGHGDLRCEHVLLERAIEIVDGVEFDRALREEDVGADLAFLVMDLERHDPVLARELLRGYREAGGDPGEDQLVAFHALARALVRVKIELLRAAQVGPGGERAAALARAGEYRALAQRIAWHVRLAPLTVVGGLSASGKTTVARELARRSGRPLLSSDVERTRMLGLELTARGGPEVYAPEVGREVYRRLGELAAAAVARRGGAVVDASFLRAGDRHAFEAAARDAGRPLRIETTAPPSVLLARARLRALDPARISDADEAVVARQLRTRELGWHDARPDVAVDTSRGVEATLDALALGLEEVLIHRAEATAPRARRHVPSS
ncbi:MAG TPA: AAA family ATPase [Solirubrobacteraceae bacterium]|nr:AAA family ATPase [Solirubrobacteraceae bacterium]